MLQTCLGFWMKGLTSESKMLLIYMLNDMDSTKIYKTSVLDMAKRYGVTVAAIERALKTLNELQLVERQSNQGQGKAGRPITTYMINFDMIKDKMIIERISELKENLLKEHLFSREKMTLSNRLLSLLLVMHSDFSGRVYNLSSRMIKDLTGFTREQLRTQMKKLKNIGFITYVLNGISIPKGDIFSSIYFLSNIKEGKVRRYRRVFLPITFLQLLDKNIKDGNMLNLKAQEFFKNIKPQICDYIYFITLLSLENIINNSFIKEKLGFRTKHYDDCKRVSNYIVKDILSVNITDQYYKYMVDYVYYILHDYALRNSFSGFVAFGFYDDKICAYVLYDNGFI